MAGRKKVNSKKSAKKRPRKRYATLGECQVWLDEIMKMVPPGSLAEVSRALGHKNAGRKKRRRTSRLR